MGTRNASRYTRFLGAADMGLSAATATTGVWNSVVTSNIYSFHKVAAATNSVVNLTIPRSFGQLKSDDLGPSIVRMFYLVATADLSSAPTVILNKLSAPTTTGIVARSAVTQALTFGGVDTVGTTSTAGNHIAIVTLAAPLQLQDNETLVCSFTMNEAATSVLDIFGMQIVYA